MILEMGISLTGKAQPYRFRLFVCIVTEWVRASEQSAAGMLPYQQQRSREQHSV